MKIQETDATGTPIQEYVLTMSTTGKSGSVPKSSSAVSDDPRLRVKPEVTTRLDIIPVPSGQKGRSSTPTPAASSTSKAYSSSSNILLAFANRHLAPLFLPNGYPHTVTPDYTPYRTYNALQAFASAIAGQLSARAVLQTLGMNSETSSSASRSGSNMATYATLLNIAQNTIGNLSTILFGNYMSSRISSEVKFYRYFADITNDTAFLLDLTSPSLPAVFKIPSLCLSSALRAVCGVAGGSSKAVLGMHFAADGNVGDLSAKDGSQETLVGLIGMWMGGLVVSRVDSLSATWCWMVGLLVLHLCFNYLAVRSVRFKVLNLGRATTVLDSLLRGQRCATVEEVGREEGIFGASSVLRDGDGKIIARARIGVEIRELAKSMGGFAQAGSGSIALKTDGLQRLLQVFRTEQYLLWLVPYSRRVLVIFKEGASHADQLKAWCHAMRASQQFDWSERIDSSILELISRTLESNNSAWQQCYQSIEAAGWDVAGSKVESNPGRRLKFVD